MGKFKKIEKEFLITNSSLNVYSFRLLTSGYLMDEYQKNPIGYRMHNRDEGVVVRWEDFRIDGDNVYAKPVINLSHPKGQQTVDEVENGFLNGASVGHYVILEVSDDPALKLPNQQGPTVTRWFNRECSLVDIPGNIDSLSLFDANDNPLKLENLADLLNQTSIMKQLFLTPEQITKLNLKADPTPQDVDAALDDLVARAHNVNTMQQQLNQALSDKKKAEDDLAAFKKAANEKKVADLVAAAVADGKITKEAGEDLKVDYKDNAEGLEKLLSKLPKYTPVTQQLQAGASNDELAKMTWEQLDKAGKLEDLKAKNIDLFKEKYKAEFGVEYKG